MSKICIICGDLIPQGRIDALKKMGKIVNRCVEHADAEKYTAHIVITGKTGDEIEIIKDPNIARYLDELDKTKGRHTIDGRS